MTIDLILGLLTKTFEQAHKSIYHTLSSGFPLRRGGAAAIYDSTQSFEPRDPPTPKNLLSAVVHVAGQPSSAGLQYFDILTPDSPPVSQARHQTFSFFLSSV